MINVVVDTVIFLRALINPRGLNEKVIRRRNEFNLVISEQIIKEVTEVLCRPIVRNKFPHITDVKVKDMLDIVGTIETVTIKSRINVCRDPKDNKFLECALDGGADYLVTADKDLLDIKIYGRTKIITAAEFTRILDSLSA